MPENVIFQNTSTQQPSPSIPQPVSPPPTSSTSKSPPDPFEQPIAGLSSTPPSEVSTPPVQAQPQFSQVAASTEIAPPSVSPLPTPPPPPPGAGGGLPLVKILIGGGGIIVVIVLIILLRLLFSAVGGRGGGNVTLTYWGLWESPNVMQPLIAGFEQKYPNIKVVYSKEDPNHYTERLITRIPAGTGPDIFRFHNAWVPMLHTLLLPLSSDVITKSDFQKEFYPVAQEDLIRNGAIYGIPLEIDTLSMFVNPRILQAGGVSIPQTWDIFRDTVRTLTVKDENHKIKTAGTALGTYDNITHAPDIISLFLLQNGVDPTHLTATPQSAQFASDALSFYETFTSPDVTQSTWDNSLDPSKVAFAKENLAIYFGYSWDVFEIKALNPTLNFNIYPMPHLPAPAKPITVASYWVEGVSIKTKHPKEALLFMNYLSQKETEEKLFSEQAKTRLFGEPYARVDLAERLKDNPYLAPVIGQANNAVSSIFAGDTRDSTGISAQLNGYLGNAVRSGEGGGSTDTAVKTLSDGVAQILHQYGEQ